MSEGSCVRLGRVVESDDEPWYRMREVVVDPASGRLVPASDGGEADFMAMDVATRSFVSPRATVGSDWICHRARDRWFFRSRP